MATTIGSSGITFSDSTLANTASASTSFVPPIDIQTFTGSQASGTNGTGTWTKPNGGQTWAMLELWGGGAGGQGNTGGCAGGYTMQMVPLSQLPASFTCNAPNNNSSWNNGSGQPASIVGVNTANGASGYAATTGASLTATQGNAGSAGTGWVMGPSANAGGGKGGHSALGIWGGTGTGASGNNPGGGSGTNGGNGGTYGGCVQVRVTCW